MGILAALIVGGFAGWLAEKAMKSDMGLLMNIVLGVVGAIVFSFLLRFLGIGVGSPASFSLAYLVTGFLGACLLIFVGRMFKR